MKLRQFIIEMANLRQEYMDKEVTIEGKNGLILPASIKLVLKDNKDALNMSGDNISSIMIT